MFIVSFVFTIYSATAFLSRHETIVVNDFTNCLTQLVERNFKEPGTLTFASSDKDDQAITRFNLEILKKINSKLKYSLTIVTLKKEAAKNDYVEKTAENEDKNPNQIVESKEHGFGNRIPNQMKSTLVSYYVIVIKNYKEILYLVTKMISSRNLNPNAKFVILIFNNSEDVKAKDDLEEIFTYLFQYNVLEVAVVKPLPKQIRIAKVYSWKPLDPPKYCGHFNDTAYNRLFVTNVCDHGLIKYNRNLFKSKMPTDMKGCLLNILAIEKQPFASGNKKDPNIEINLINQMLKKFNFKTEYKILWGFRGEREKNGKWTGALGALTSKRGQILLGAIYPDYDVHEDFECSTTYLADLYTWVVPRAYSLPPWRALIIIFKKSVWYSVVGGFLFSVLSWRLLGKLNSDSAYNQSIHHCFLNAWITALGFCNYTRPFKDSLRVFYVFFNMYCMLLLTAYDTKLIDVLKNPSFEYQIKTTEELVTSGLRFGGFEQLHDLFFNSSDPFDYHLGEEWIDVDDMYKALIDVAVHRNFSVLCSRLELAHLSSVMPELSDEYGNNKYYAFEKDMFSVPMELVALKGFAYIPNFSKALESFRQNGINAMLRRQFAMYNERRRARLTGSLSKKINIKSLSLQHLQGGFLALAVGSVSGTLTLMIEIVYHRYFVQNAC